MERKLLWCTIDAALVCLALLLSLQMGITTRLTTLVHVGVFVSAVVALTALGAWMRVRFRK